MPSLNVLIEKGEVCQCLRAKTLFYQPVGESPGGSKKSAQTATPEGPFWCAITQSLIGPDGQFADAESCRPGRACCETA